MVGNFTSFNKSWGFLEVYLASWLRFFDIETTISDVHGLLMLILCSETVGILLFPVLNTRFTVKFMTSICMCLVSFGFLLYSYCSSMKILMIASLLIGASTGLRQLVISFIMVEILPNNTGFAAGLGAMTSSFSVLLFTTFGQYVMNPHKKNPTIEIQEGERAAYYFDYGVASQYPWYTFYLFCMCIIIATCVVPLLSLKVSKIVKKKEDIEQKKVPQINSIAYISDRKGKANSAVMEKETGSEKNSPGTNIFRIALSANFIGLFALLSFITCIPIFFNMNLKVLGLKYFNDTQINRLGFLQTFCLLCSRLLGGWIVDKRGIRNFIKYVLIMSAFAYFTFLHMSTSFAGFVLSN